MRHLAPLMWFCTLLALPWPGSGRAAQPDATPPLVEIFAICAGRYAALSTESWTAPGQRIDSANARASFADLYDAIGPRADDRSATAITLRARRIEARRQTILLLNTAQYAADPRRRRMASARLIQLLRACEGLLPN